MKSKDTLYKRRERYIHLPSGPATVTVDRPVRLIKVLVNTGAPGGALVSIYNNTSASGELVAMYRARPNKQVTDYDLFLDIGMTIVKPNQTSDLTIVYQ